MDPPASPHPFQPGVHHHEQIQRVVSPVNQPGLAHYQNQYASYEQYHRNDTDVAQHDTRQQVLSHSDENTLIRRYPKIGQFDDNQCHIRLQIREECIDTKKSKDRRTGITSADLGSQEILKPTGIYRGPFERLQIIHQLSLHKISLLERKWWYG